VPSREKAGTVTASLPNRPFSPVRFVEEESRNTGIFRVFRGKKLRNLSAVQTAWRRERDSNLQYGFEPLNPGVSVGCSWQTHTREFCSETPVRVSRSVRFPFAIRIDSKGRIIGDSVAESRHLGKSDKPEWLACDCAPSTQSQDGKGSLAETIYIGMDF
jgi:hypothetical protein